MTTPASLESLLFASPKPLSIKKIAQLLNTNAEAIERAVAQLQIEYNTAKRGIRILRNGDEIQMATAPEHRKLVQSLVRDDTETELTRPQLETLTIIAYRGPVTKSALEQIRGVHCGLIVRNLMMRGLIDAEENTETLTMTYHVSFEFLRWLGVHDVQELPNYTELHNDARIESVLAMAATVAEHPIAVRSVP